MPLYTPQLDTAITAAKASFTHIGIVTSYDIEPSGGSPVYTRKPVTWTTAVDGIIRPTTDLVFDMPAGSDVYYWQVYNSLTGGTGYGQIQLPYEDFVAQGVFTLLAASTGIDLNS